MARESRRKERERHTPKKIEISLSKKNIVIRAIIAGTCLLLGSFFFVNSCSQMNSQSTELDIKYPKFYNIDKEDEVLFDNQINIDYYYASNEENSKKETIEKINNILNNSKEYHKLLDHDTLYESNEETLHNLKYINDNPNKWIKVDSKLYKALIKAEEIRESTNGKYSIFAGRLLDYWEEIISIHYLYGDTLETVESKDPMFNEYFKEDIENIVNSINSTTTYLEFKEDTKEVKYNVKEEDSNNVILDFGFFENAYYLDYLRAVFTSENLTSGIITSNNGMVVSLGLNQRDGYNQLNALSFQTLYNNGSKVYDYSFAYNGTLSSMMFNPLYNFNVHKTNEDYHYYYFYNENNIIIRSLILNAKTGYSDFKVHSTFTFSSETTLVNQLKDNYNLYFNESDDYGYEYLTNFEGSNNYGAMIVYNNGNTNIEYQGATTLVYSSLIKNFFEEGSIPYVKVSATVKTKIVATKGD